MDLHSDVHSSKLIIGVCYRPPNVNEEVETQLLAQMERAKGWDGDNNGGF